MDPVVEPASDESRNHFVGESGQIKSKEFVRFLLQKQEGLEWDLTFFCFKTDIQVHGHDNLRSDGFRDIEAFVF